MKNFSGKKALFTSGASGIGKIIGRLVLERGAELIIWDINDPAIKSTIDDFKHLGVVKGFVVDIADAEQIKYSAEVVKKEVGIIDVLINNAGVVVGKYFSQHIRKLKF